MATAAATPCPVCNHPLPAGRRACPHCHAPVEWQELLQAVDFAVRRFQQWATEGELPPPQFQGLEAYYQEQRRALAKMASTGQPLPADLFLTSAHVCWSCKGRTGPAESHCPHCGAPVDAPAVRSLRFLQFLCHEVKKHEEAGRLNLSQAHEFLAQTRERMAALRRRLKNDRIPEAKPAAAPAERAPRTAEPAPARGHRAAPPAPPRHSLWELLLDPHSIQWLLAAGGALLVIGLVIWLATLGVFANKLVIAVALGAANLVLLLAGWYLILATRYQLAGRALTLLACLVMPLNLWFYHANDLITLEGHLWVPALVCCVLYAASALVLRDPLFVYVLMAGVTLTGLLLLADLHLFWQIAAPSALLVGLGLAALHAERAFPPDAGTFSRRRFGLPFFWSSQALLGAGLLLLLGAQVAGWLHQPVFRHFGLKGPPAVVTDPALQTLAILLVLAGTYAFVYADLVVRRVGVYIYFAVFTLLWAEVLIILRFDLAGQEEVILVALALTALAVNLVQAALAKESPAVERSGPPAALFLSTLPVLLGLLLFLRAADRNVYRLWPYDLTWSYVCAMALTALTCRAGAYLHRHTRPVISAIYFFGTAAATLVGAAGLLSVLGLKSWDVQAPLLMLIPIAYLAAARVYHGHTAEKPLILVAHVATAVMLVAVLLAALHVTRQAVEPVRDAVLNLRLAAFCATATAFYVLAAGVRRHGANVYLATLTACGAVWQLLTYFHVEPEYYTLAFALLGFALLVGYRLAVLERWQKAGRLSAAAFDSANMLMSLAFVAGALLALGRVLDHAVEWRLVALLATLAVLSLLAAWLVRHHGWRGWYVALAVAEGLLAFVCVEVLSHLGPWQKLEIFSVIAGLVLLALGHGAWYREGERQSDLATLGLWFGSLLAGLPLAVAVLYHRSRHHFSTPDELGLLAVGLLLLATGLLLKLKATTLTGGVLVGLYLVTLLLFVRFLEEIQTAALLLAGGGAVLFVIGLLLSVYRERLLALPGQIKRRRGVFKVLGWR